MGCCQSISMLKKPSTKIGNQQPWQEEAKTLFFQEGLKIGKIAETLGVTRKTISTYLTKQPGFEEEKVKRKADNQEKRKVYQKSWVKEKRKRVSAEGSFIEAALLKKQHIIDVMVLSADRH
ncbi:hypothetical protein [Geosporobacter ferrireducens]|nr:hypothetical protein [Geosporobacter ferrireducens]